VPAFDHPTLREVVYPRLIGAGGLRLPSARSWSWWWGCRWRSGDGVLLEGAMSA